MKNILASILALFIAQEAKTQEDLIEFSTSMDFEEFEAVVARLEVIDIGLAKEISEHVGNFKNSSSLEQSREFQLKSGPGYIYLEREDQYAFVIAIFSSKEVITNIENSYEQGINDLGI